jgi:hypothetical protein
VTMMLVIAMTMPMRVNISSLDQVDGVGLGSERCVVFVGEGGIGAAYTARTPAKKVKMRLRLRGGGAIANRSHAPVS